MAVEVKVLLANLPTTGYVDVTVDGFGTPQAALLYGAGIDHNFGTNYQSPQDRGASGLWAYDGGNQKQYGIGWRAEDASVGADTARATSTNSALPFILSTSDAEQVTYSVANTTNGIRISYVSGSTTFVRPCIVVLFKGFKSVKAGATANNETTEVTNTIGFPFDGIFFLYSGQVPNLYQALKRPMFGIARWNGSSVDQMGMQVDSADAVNPTVVNSSLNDYCVLRSYLNDGAGSDYYVSVTGRTSTEFKTTASSTGITGTYGWLAFELEDGDGFYADFHTAKNTGSNNDTEAISGFGFTPQMVGMFSVRGTTLNSTSTTPTGAMCIGAADADTEVGFAFCEEDNESANTNTSNIMSDTSFMYLMSHTEVQSGVANVDSFDADGVTLRWSDIADGAYQYLLWSFGTAPGGMNLNRAYGPDGQRMNTVLRM